MNTVTVSDLTGKEYIDEECVFFRNIHQSAFYISKNVLPVDVFADSEGKLVMVFKREDHNKIIKLWMANKEKEEMVK